MAPTQKQVSQNIPRFIEVDNQTVSQMGGGGGVHEQVSSYGWSLMRGQ